ncbi:MAG: TSUP family transporter [Actinophytocola sp.]|nr:TSUP family transporter [Actinophytocola sp.]
MSVADDAMTRIGIGVILLITLAVQPLVKRMRSTAHPADAPGRWDIVRTGAAAGTGVAAGAATMLANAAGPVMVLYLFLTGLSKVQFLGTMAWFFLAVNLLKAPISVGLGLITWHSVVLTLTLLPAITFGAWSGLAVAHRINQKHFELATLFLTGAGAALLIL